MEERNSAGILVSCCICLLMNLDISGTANWYFRPAVLVNQSSVTQATKILGDATVGVRFVQVVLGRSYYFLCRKLILAIGHLPVRPAVYRKKQAQLSN